MSAAWLAALRLGDRIRLLCAVPSPELRRIRLRLLVPPPVALARRSILRHILPIVVLKLLAAVGQRLGFQDRQLALVLQALNGDGREEGKQVDDGVLEARQVGIGTRLLL